MTRAQRAARLLRAKKTKNLEMPCERSTGQRNTLSKPLRWRIEVQGLSGALVEAHRNDNDGVMHAEVAHAAARWINDSAADLDMELRPLIEAIRTRDNESGPGNSGLYQVRDRRRFIAWLEG